MKHNRLLEDGRLAYRGGNGLRSLCRLDIVLRGGNTTVVFTELMDNPGMSVTNAVEEVVRAFCMEYLATGMVVITTSSDVRFFERYVAPSLPQGERMALITFDFSDFKNCLFTRPAWSHSELTLADVMGDL